MLSTLPATKLVPKRNFHLPTPTVQNRAVSLREGKFREKKGNWKRERLRAMTPFLGVMNFLKVVTFASRNFARGPS